ncbi:hypothetical protein [Hymenobacter sp. 5414T-23]|uniref:hypothetical protein n=1 Tax=Hymenobacter sp. 5414T-23 TaxID=2932252 RepID=UPI001FD5614A|nr:hypothetical protein [Hymenobacter sp. 5414T-23]UOQ81064.1 hypothetical protein MUN83_20005 [Hymenobacter sp. 5414T-23]
MTNTTHTPLLSLDDIVFEGRNKAYGAYVLRRIYGRHLYTAVLLATALTALLIAFPILIQHFWPSKTVSPGIIELPPPIIELQDITLPKDKVAPQPAARPRTVVVRPRQKRYLPLCPTRLPSLLLKNPKVRLMWRAL